MTNLQTMLELMQTEGMRGDVWIDGSFLTEKLNPKDVDVALVLSGTEFHAMNARSRRFFDWFRTNNLQEQYQFDNYAFVRDDAPESELMYAYWLKQFGFSRGEDMKGLAVVKLPFLVMP